MSKKKSCYDCLNLKTKIHLSEPLRPSNTCLSCLSRISFVWRKSRARCTEGNLIVDATAKPRIMKNVFSKNAASKLIYASAEKCPDFVSMDD